jgi:hypothetical protein
MSRRLIAAAAIVAAAVTAVPALAENPFAEQLRPTKLDSRLARQVTLKSSDLPIAYAHAAMQFEGARCASFHPNVSSFVVTGRRSSAFQNRKQLITVMSSVRVFASELDARGDFRRVAAATGGSCLGELLASQGMRVLSTTFSRNVAVGDSAVRYRVVARVNRSDGKVLVHADMLLMRKGRVAVTLVTVAPLRSPSGQSDLLSMMASRVQPQLIA